MIMERKFWSQRTSARNLESKMGPYATREAAVEAFRAAFPHKGPEYMRSSKKCQFLTGYGEIGPHFSIEWHDA
jgi:hypothetical protein